MRRWRRKKRIKAIIDTQLVFCAQFVYHTWSPCLSFCSRNSLFSSSKIEPLHVSVSVALLSPQEKSLKNYSWVQDRKERRKKEKRVTQLHQQVMFARSTFYMYSNMYSCWDNEAEDKARKRRKDLWLLTFCRREWISCPWSEWLWRLRCFLGQHIPWSQAWQQECRWPRRRVRFENRVEDTRQSVPQPGLPFGPRIAFVSLHFERHSCDIGTCVSLVWQKNGWQRKRKKGFSSVQFELTDGLASQWCHRPSLHGLTGPPVLVTKNAWKIRTVTKPPFNYKVCI